MRAGGECGWGSGTAHFLREEPGTPTLSTFITHTQRMAHGEWNLPTPANPCHSLPNCCLLWAWQSSTSVSPVTPPSLSLYAGGELQISATRRDCKCDRYRQMDRLTLPPPAPHARYTIHYLPLFPTLPLDQPNNLCPRPTLRPLRNANFKCNYLSSQQVVP